MTKVLLMYSTHTATEAHLTRLGTMGCEASVAESEEDAIRKAASAEVIFGHRYLRQCLPHAPSLRWVQTTAGGVDRLPLRELAEKEVVLARSVCMVGTIARHAHTMAWTLTRGLAEFFNRQKAGQWKPEIDWLPAPRRAMILGAGAIGQEISRLLSHDEIEVTMVNRSVPDWRSRLPEMDWIFLALPATPETKNIFDRAAFASLKPTATFVLAGRAETLDFNALCDALHTGALGGAAIDLLPDAWQNPVHPVWRTPRLLITPHVAAHSAERPFLLEREAEEQMLRYKAGQPLANTVHLATP
jgi:phosphoglycerate dehydrogenase-like enzyme